MSTALTPYEYVATLQQGEDGARDRIERLVRQPLTRLVDLVIERNRLSDDRQILNERMLHWVSMYLRSRDLSEFAGMDLETFLAQVLFGAARVLTPPTGTVQTDQSRLASFLRAVVDRIFHLFSVSTGDLALDRVALRGTRDYSVRTYLQPFERVGGDWVGVDVRDRTEVLWLLVTDVTGHGYPAHILARGLPFLWQSRRVAEARARGDQPQHLLDAMGRELEAVLPGDLFVEASLGRFAPAGDACVAVAGACPVVLRQSGQDEPTLYTLKGTFLGLELGIPRDQMVWALRAGDELLIASDGLFEQPADDDRRLKESLSRRLARRLAEGRTLHEATLETLTEVLRTYPQCDDITVVTLSVRGRTFTARPGVTQLRPAGRATPDESNQTI
jgi:hypothetical protein